MKRLREQVKVVRPVLVATLSKARKTTTRERSQRPCRSSPRCAVRLGEQGVPRSVRLARSEASSSLSVQYTQAGESAESFQNYKEAMFNYERACEQNPEDGLPPLRLAAGARSNKTSARHRLIFGRPRPSPQERRDPSLADLYAELGMNLNAKRSTRRCLGSTRTTSEQEAAFEACAEHDLTPEPPRFTHLGEAVMSTLDATRNTVVVGLQWGDEGKGKAVDLLAGNACHVVRFQAEITPATPWSSTARPSSPLDPERRTSTRYHLHHRKRCGRPRGARQELDALEARGRGITPSADPQLGCAPGAAHPPHARWSTRAGTGGARSATKRASVRPMRTRSLGGVSALAHSSTSRASVATSRVLKPRRTASSATGTRPTPIRMTRSWPGQSLSPSDWHPASAMQ